MGRARGKGGGPEFVRYFGPLLDALRALGGSGAPNEVTERVATDLQVPDAAVAELTSTGVPRYYNQVAWARLYLVRAGLLDKSTRGVWSLTATGARTRLAPEEAVALFRRLSREFRDERAQKRGTGSVPGVVESADQPPDEAEPGLRGYREQLRATLVGLPASGFERLVQRLLREAGFSEVAVTGRSGDNGIDGHGKLVVGEFVSFRVLFQCKRYRGSVSPSEVRDFRGAAQGRADKGIIITTGTFTQAAQAEAERDGVPPIELVHGEALLDMFERLKLGLVPVQSYDVDAAFFEQFRDAPDA